MGCSPDLMWKKEVEGTGVLRVGEWRVPRICGEDNGGYLYTGRKLSQFDSLDESSSFPKKIPTLSAHLKSESFRLVCESC